ncbi:hypothetical protein PI124_g23851 [Phytophthora idaei]|nr:hypothetical protein PI124_g23851 [Phytophthora idaei]
MFGCMPRLKRLDVSEIPLLSRHLPKILRAASRCCPRLEFLLMPRKDDCFFVVKEPRIRWLMTALVATLETWFSTGRCGGLKQLTMPTCDEGNERSSTQYIEAMARFCPGIEYIDGFKQVLLDGQEECPDVWSISLETWQAFNASCTALRSFNWTLVPFGDPFFRVIGEHVKPQLTSLSLTANMRRNYENYLRQHVSVTSVDEWNTHPGYGTSCRNPGDALRGYPALKKLIIEIISIGGHEKDRLAKFYREIVAILRFLADTSEEELGAARCATKHLLTITNPYTSKVRQGWSERYMRDEFLPLLESVSEGRPSLRIKVSFAGRNGYRFIRIGRISLGWRLSRSSGYSFDDVNASTDGRDSDSDTSIFSAVESEDEAMSEDDSEAMVEDLVEFTDRS